MELKLADRLDALKRTIEADGKWYVSKGVSGPVALLPGDLAVWDGHIAMVVGNGMMIEAGYQSLRRTAGASSHDWRLVFRRLRCRVNAAMVGTPPYAGCMPRVIGRGPGSDKSVSEAGPEAQPDGYADDDEFRSAYEVEKPRWLISPNV